MIRTSVTATPADTRRATAPVAAGRISIAIKTAVELPAEDSAALDALIQERPEVGVFLSRAWLSGLVIEPPAGFEPSLVLLRDSGGLRGVVPMGVRVRAGRVRVTLLGGGMGSDRVDLLAARGFEAACADRWLAWLGETCGRRACILELRDVPADSPLWSAIHRANAERPTFAMQPREIQTLPYLNLPEVRGGAGCMPPSLDKHRRWLERRGRLRIETLCDPREALSAFETLTRFLHERWHGHSAGSALDQPRAQRLHRHVIPLLLRDGQLRMIRLSSDMRTIAVFYGFAIGRWWGYYLAGYDRQWAGRIHLGQLTLAAAIDAAAREGAVEFDFLKGVERVKYLWPVRERSTLDADVFSDRPAAQLCRATRAARDAAAALVKSARGLYSLVARP